MNNSIDQQFVEFIIKSLVSEPDAVQVERRIDEKGVLLELTVAPEDLGRVIGKRGATAQSVRTLLRALGTKNDARYNLKIVDNGEPGAHGPGSHQQSSDDSHADTDNNDTEDDRQEPKIHDEAEDAEERERQEVPAPAAENENSVVSKTRKELEELDDLDV
jgi:predicted RNA-binding protein YlqC (UPF0109 family)